MVARGEARVSRAVVPAWYVSGSRDLRYSSSLERGLAMLACFTPEHPMLGIADLANALGLSRSTTHRYVITLVALGFLEQDGSRKYRLGLRARDLGMRAIDATGLREISHPSLVALRDAFGHTVSLGVLDEVEVVCIDHASGLHRVRGVVGLGLGLRPGSRLPAYCTALGKVLLAYLPEDVRHELITGMTLVKRAANTITSKRQLLEELSEIAKSGGLVSSEEEFAPGVHSLAMPIRDQHDTVIAAISVTTDSSAPISLAEDDALREIIGTHLESTAREISAALGLREKERPGNGGQAIDQEDAQ